MITYGTGFVGSGSVGNVHLLVGKIRQHNICNKCHGQISHQSYKYQVIKDTEITGLSDGSDVLNGVLNGDITMETGELLTQYQAVAGAQPVHTPVDYVLHSGMPCAVDGCEVDVIDDVGDGVGVLEATEEAQLQIVINISWIYAFREFGFRVFALSRICFSFFIFQYQY